MWTNNLLKQNGKNQLNNYFWSAAGLIIIMTVIHLAISYLISTCNSFLFMNDFYRNLSDDFSAMLKAIEDFYDSPASAYYRISSSLLNLVAVVFLTGILEIGKCRYFYHARKGDSDFGNLFWAFQGGRYLHCVKITFRKTIEIVLYTFLLIIPGLVKQLEYILVPYLLAENPNLSKERVLNISRQTMKGEKWKCFLLIFSFIGWFFLGVCTCYLGFIYVIPYYEATKTEFYACMRAKMLATGITTEEELTGYHVSENYPQNQNFGRNVNPYDMPNPYDMQSPYQNPNAYPPQSPYQPNNTPPLNPYDTQNSGFPQSDIPSAPDNRPPVSPDKNPYDTENSDSPQSDIPPAPDSRPHVNLDKNPYDDNQNHQF